MRRRSALAAAASALLLGLGMNPAFADDDAKIDARIESWGRNCKNAIAVKFPKATMADIHVVPGATWKRSVDAGEITLKDIKQQGISFNYTVDLKGKQHTGYCNTDGNGTVTEVQKGN